MSMVTTNVAQVLTQESGGVGAKTTETAEVRRNTPRPYKARMATKVKWALGDAMDKNLDAQKRIQRILDYVEQLQVMVEASGDIAELALIAKLNLEAARIAGGLAEQERTLTGAIAESKPAVNDKKSYSAQL